MVFGEVVVLLLEVGLCMAHTKYMMSDIKDIVGGVVVIRTQMTRCVVSFSIRSGRTGKADMFEPTYPIFHVG